LLVQGKPVGNITVQAFRKNVYTENHLNIFRNIALYTAIALDNASAYHKLDEEKVKVEQEREKSEKLLLNILPQETAQELKETGKASTRRFEKATVLFTDFKGFTQIAEGMSPEEVVQNLDYCFKAFDRICKKHKLEKIKTIGDAYMAAGGIPTPDGDNPQRAAAAALEMTAFMKRWKEEKEADGKQAWEVRIGLHTGPLVAGVVGEDKFAYDVWGDTVNTASRMESSGAPGRVNISDDTYQLLKGAPGLSFEFRGEVEAKGKGKMGMWFVTPL
jgi:class 3 adenylate cyclase